MTDIIIIKLGGSLLFTKNYSIRARYLYSFRKVIRNFIQKGKRFIIIVGGGTPCRLYQQEYARKLRIKDETALHWIGTFFTRINGELIRCFFGTQAYKKVYFEYRQTIRWEEPVLIAAGFKPGESTNFDAVLLAKKFGVGTIINLSDVDYIYTKDPDKYVTAAPVHALGWNAYKKKILKTTVHTPGMHAPFDPVATRRAQRLKIKVYFANGKNLKNLENILSGKEFIGTVLG